MSLAKLIIMYHKRLWQKHLHNLKQNHPNEIYE